MGHSHFVDVLKGICIIFIIITHFSWESWERIRYFFPFYIDMAVPVFMILSGYVYNFSYRKRNINNIGEAYALSNIVDKIIRYTLPFLLIYLFEICYLYFKGSITLSLSSIFVLCLDFFAGGGGKGSYYYPVMMQFIFIFPIIFFIIKKYDFKGVIICGIVNALYELLKSSYHMNEECYRLLVFRYILVIAVGCYFAWGKSTKKSYSLLSFFVGLLFIILYSYINYAPKVIIYWTGTSFVACLYIIPIVKLLLQRYNEIKSPFVEVLGKASYNIFLVQMVWYRFFFSIVEGNADRPMQLIISIIVCCSIGVLYYYLEMPLTKKIIEKIKVAKLIGNIS